MRRFAPLERPNQPDRNRRPGRIGDDALAGACAGREQVKLIILAADQPAEQKAAGGARDEQVAVESQSEVFGAIRSHQISSPAR